MFHKISAAVVSLGMLAAGSAVHAATLTLFPSSPGVAGVSGNQSTSAPGFGNSSFQAGPVLDSDNKSEIYISATVLFGHSITVGDITSMSYFTNKPGNAAAVDWTLNIYTNLNSGTGANAGSFYESHLVAEPYFTQTSNTDDPASAWHQWSTNAGSNSLRFYDAQRDGNIFGTYTDPTLTTLHSGTFTWANGQSNNYNPETVEYLSFQTGSAWAAGFNGLLDGFSIAAGGQTATVNFEAVSLPASAWGGLVLLAGVGVMKFRRKNATV